MRILTIIPARGGSKGIPNKNIIDVKGRPLISYTIDVAKKALEAKIVAEAIISTDSELIAKVCRAEGLDVPFLRPASMSHDTAKSNEYVSHALEFFENKGAHFEAVLILQPTSPLRTFEDLRKAVDSFKQSDSDSLISVYKETYVDDTVAYHLAGDYLEPLTAEHNRGVRRQEHGEKFIRNGAIYLTSTKFFSHEKKIISGNPAYYIMPKHQSVNIDTYDDLHLVEKLI